MWKCAHSAALACLMFSLAGCLSVKPHADSASKPKSVLCRQNELGVKQLVVPSFETLPLSRKLYAYYMAQAIECGRDITWTQNSREGLQIRNLFEALWPYRDALPKQKRYALLKYLFQLYRDHGNYSWNANVKFIPEGFTLEDALSLVAQAGKQGLDGGSAKRLESELKRLGREIFDGLYNPKYLARDGGDLIQQSNSNYYGPGVTQAGVDGLAADLKSHSMIYPHLDKEGHLAVDYQRIGGRFDKEMKGIEQYLQRAQEYGTVEEKMLIGLLLRVLHSADMKDFDAFNTAWVQYQPKDLDVMIGFIESYLDPLHIRSTWEGFITLRNLDPVEQARSEAIRKHFAYFESAMPVDARFKRTEMDTIPQSQGIYLIYGGGESGESPFSGVNLPNDRDITKRYGSKSYTLLNIIDDIGEDPKERRKEDRLFYSKKYLDALKDYDSDLGLNLLVSFHEVLGHGSGRLAEGLDDDTVNRLLGEMGDTVEECRADTAALYHLTDHEHLLEFGVLPQTYSPEKARKFSELAVINELTHIVGGYVLKFKDDTTQISEPHRLGNQVILNYLLENGGVQVLYQGGNKIPRFETGDLGRTRAVLGNLWAELQIIRSTGDLARAKALFGHYGAYTTQHQAWRTALKKDIQRIKPRYSIYLNPKYELVKDAQGNITDVAIRYYDGKKGPALVVEEQRRMSGL